jgi:hypothetical protein
VRGAWREVLLLLVGVALGYTLAVTTRASRVPMMDQARHYVVTHQTESFVGLILVGVIIYLAGNKGGKK